MKILEWFKNLFHVSQEDICKYGLHDYTDALDITEPIHFYQYTCRHCGGKFTI